MFKRIIYNWAQKKRLYYDIAKSYEDWFIQMNLMLSIILNLSMWILIYKRVEPTQEPVPLHYNIQFGISLIGEWYKIFVIPVLGIIITAVNFFFAYFLFKLGRIFSYLLTASATVMQAILLFSLHLLTSYII